MRKNKENKNDDVNEGEGLIPVETSKGVRIFSVCLNSFIVVFGVVVLLVAALVWRIYSSPLDIGFAKNYVQAALRNAETGDNARIDKLVLHWPDLRGPLLLGLRGGKVYDAQERLVVSVDEVALSLDKMRLLFGKISPEALILKSPSLLVKRRVDNRFEVGFGGADGDDTAVDAPIVQQEAFTARILEVLASHGAHMGADRGGMDGVLSSLKRFQIDDAKVIVDDEVLKRSWYLPRFDIEFQSAEGGLAAVYGVDLPGVSGGGAARRPRLEGDLLIDHETRDAAVNMRLNDFNLELLAEKVPELEMLSRQDVVADIELKALLGADLDLRYVEMSGISPRGQLDVPGWSEAVIPYQDFAFEGLYNGETQDVNLRAARITLADSIFTGSGTFNHSRGVVGALRIDAQKIAHEKLDILWPVSFREDAAYDWVVGRIGDGVFKDVFAELRLNVAEDDAGARQFDFSDLRVGFAFDGMGVDYRAPLLPIANASGHGVFEYDSEMLHVELSRGEIGSLTVDKARLELYNIIEPGAGVADVNLKLSGPLGGVLSYIEQEPIAVDLGVPLDAVKGDVNLSVNVEFPVSGEVLAKDVEVLASGVMRDVSLPQVVEETTLSEGPFAIGVKNGVFTLDGKGKLDGRPITLDYMTFLDSTGRDYSSRVKVDVVTDDTLRARLGIDLSDFAEGSIPARVLYTKMQDGRIVADVDADLTPARLFIDALGYEKTAGEKGEAHLKADLEDGVLRKVTGLRASGVGLSLAESDLRFRSKGGEADLASGRFGRFVVGETVGQAEFEYTDAGVLKLAMDGAFLDLRPFLDDDAEKEERGNKSPMQISVSVDAMRTSDDETVQYGKLYADINAAGHFNQLELDAVAGAGDIYMRFKPDETGKRVFRLEADDAGAALKAFEVYDNMHGGKLVIYAEPIRGIYDRNLVGEAEITDFKVVKAPTIAKIISRLSIGGENNLLSGTSEGLAFTKLKADFDWLFRPNGSLLVLKKGRTSGNSLGLTFEGTVDNASSEVDISGTVVPLSAVNKMIGKIPLVGDILTGGSGGIFAATYKVKGQEDEAEVSVNPLSVLAPGILRRILFE